MANDFAGIVVHPGQDTSLFKAVDSTLPPKSPEPPKPPAGWDKTPSYKMAHDMRKQ